jgi:hypothetical protein
MQKDYIGRRTSQHEMSTPVYLSKNIGQSYPGDNTMVPWFNVLLNSTLSTTRYLTDNYANVQFKVLGQEEKGGHIYRVSEFIMSDRVIVHSIVDIPVSENPSKFIDIMREQVTPIGDALRDNGYHVEREILYHDASSKVYAMRGDVNLKITEKYYNM